ncbi:MAG: RagB/SusD family nutrient uptake outer membrane protein [Bacteroidales bacterium]|nr:RagB/SusD family nutrient uptake outer membrane protein [Bacteroidales bacterium]
MKRFLKYTILAAGAVMVLASCDDFFDRQPSNTIIASTYFSNEGELKMYCNGLVQSGMPGFTSVAIGNDAYTDLCATKSGSDFYHPGLWNASKGSGWSSGNFSFIRKCNFMLDNMTKAKGKVDDEVYNHYEGVARFWRAYAHYGKLQTFSNIPWIDHVLQKDDSILYAKRDDREYVFHKILEDMDFASENCLGTSDYLTPGRTYVNKWVCLAMKARMCLYEASYRKYHSVNPATNEVWNNKYETSDDLYKDCADACEKIISGGVFSLHNTGNPETDYSALFKSEDIPVDEVIWSRQANTEASVTHDITWCYRSATYGQKYSPTKELVDMYLNLDGKPVSTDRVDVSDEFTGRDWRMSQTISGPGYTYTPLSGKDTLKGPDFSCTLTGYEFNKWCIDKAVNYSQSLSDNSVPVLRYGEVLLNYAEAEAELGKMTETIWNLTIGALRARAGVKSVYPESAGYQRDPILYSYYNGDGSGQNGVVLSDMILEIRRERAVELCMEDGLRQLDLKRWKLGNFIARRYDNQGWRGIYLTADQVKNGFTINGYKYTLGSATTSTSYAVANTGSDATWSLSEGTYGYLIYNYKLEWDDKMYTSPVPVSALNLNPNLGQNYGWTTE